MRTHWVFLGVLVMIGLSWGWWWASRPGEERGEPAKRAPSQKAVGPAASEGFRPGRRGGSPEDDPRPPGELRAKFQRELSELERAHLSGKREDLLAAARRLRELLIEEPDLLGEAGMVLRDRQSGLPLRRALSVVLGSLPNGIGKPVVLQALRSGRLAGMERCAVLSLNIVEEESPPVYQRDGHPFVIEAAPGLVVFV
ncbi:MAG: hypothetical protein GWO24_35070, partial [Akkermansiaceae bacterium]|nr:hypothetical protein [Akkermansiaceae bacterium]